MSSDLEILNPEEIKSTPSRSGPSLALRWSTYILSLSLLTAACSPNIGSPNNSITPDQHLTPPKATPLGPLPAPTERPLQKPQSRNIACPPGANFIPLDLPTARIEACFPLGQDLSTGQFVVRLKANMANEVGVTQSLTLITTGFVIETAEVMVAPDVMAFSGRVRIGTKELLGWRMDIDPVDPTAPHTLSAFWGNTWILEGLGVDDYYVPTPDNSNATLPIA